MGYYSVYALKVIHTGDENPIEALRAEDDGPEFYAQTDNGYAVKGEDWRNWREKMIEFSKLYYEHVFAVYGTTWRAYFRNGECIVARGRVVFDLPPEWGEP